MLPHTRWFALGLALTAMSGLVFSSGTTADANSPASDPLAIKTAAVVTAPALYKGPKPSSGKVIYLTFDDGPSKYTPAIVKLLRDYHAHATFFVIGSQIRTREGTLKATASAGNPINNHTWNHPVLPRLTNTGISSQFVRTNRAIRAQGLPQPKCDRPPYGSYTQRSKGVSDRLGMRTIIWSLDTNDWRKPGAAVIARRVNYGARNGTIVLMHDGGGNRSQTVAALRSILRTLGHQGYTISALPMCF